MNLLGHLSETWQELPRSATTGEPTPVGPPIRIGYARCSTDEQDVEIQHEQLLALGVAEDRVYIDRGFSGRHRDNRAGLNQALAAVWPGTVFTVTKFDRFARNMAEAHEILTDLSGRGVKFALGAIVHDWNDPVGRRDPSPASVRVVDQRGAHR